MNIEDDWGWLPWNWDWLQIWHNIQVNTYYSFHSPDAWQSWLFLGIMTFLVLLLLCKAASVFVPFLMDEVRFRRQRHTQQKYASLYNGTVTPRPKPLQVVKVEQACVDEPEQLSDEDEDLLRAESPNAQFLENMFAIMRNSKSVDLVHNAINELIEMYEHDILSSDWEWAQDKLDKIHFQWEEEARAGNPFSFEKLMKVHDKKLRPAEERIELPDDWSEISAQFTRSSVST